MSIQALVIAGKLEPIGEELVEPDEKAQRVAFGTEAFVAWREDELPYLNGNNRSDLSPDEEVDDFLRRYQLGKPLTEIARLTPTGDGVWEVKLQQLRLVGWFSEKNCLVLTDGADVEDVKGKKGTTYASMKRSSITQRKALGLDHVSGDHRKVISSAKDNS